MLIKFCHIASSKTESRPRKNKLFLSQHLKKKNINNIFENYAKVKKKKAFKSSNSTRKHRKFQTRKMFFVTSVEKTSPSNFMKSASKQNEIHQKRSKSHQKNVRTQQTNERTQQPTKKLVRKMEILPVFHFLLSYSHLSSHNYLYLLRTKALMFS